VKEEGKEEEKKEVEKEENAEEGREERKEGRMRSRRRRRRGRGKEEKDSPFPQYVKFPLPPCTVPGSTNKSAVLIDLM
jgi:hypothetical protein